MIFTDEQALADSTEYFNGDELAAKIVVDKYLLRDRDGKLHENTPKMMHKRLAKEFARIEEKYPNPLSEEKIFEYFDKFGKIIPQGSPMAGIGNPYQIMSLSNCEVIASPEDSYGGICLTDQELAQLQKRRCGVGFDISTLRPKGLSTKNAAKTTDGIAIFMERFSRTTREVAQGGRRGALLLSISVHHPEIETFIKIKQDLSKVTGANLSVRFSDEFMKAVEADIDYEQRWPVDANVPVISQMVSAKKIWDLHTECAWATAEPGCLFWDTIKRESPADCYESEGFGTVSTNPCAELTLSAYDSCRLMAINLTQFVNKPFTTQSYFDKDEFEDVVYDTQRLMDDMIDLELEHINTILEKIKSDPEPEEVKKTELSLWSKIANNCANGRRTGLGITGLGDVIAALGYKYDSKEGVEITEDIYRTLARKSYLSSIHMAFDRGAFPAYNHELEKNHPFIKRVCSYDTPSAERYIKYGRRNIANLTTAPTGTISILARAFYTNKNNITSGIEPVYLLGYTRRRKLSGDTTKYDIIDAQGDKWEETEIEHSGYALWKEINNTASLEESPYYKATANDIDWERSVDIQATAQKWICHSISKTCNIPADSPKELVGKIYMDAWKKGCKGFTVYRDGCRTGVLVSNNDKKNKIIKTDAPDRPKYLPAKIFYPRRKNGIKYIVAVSFLGDDPYELFSWDSFNGEVPDHVSDGIIERVGNRHYRLVKDDEVVIENIGELSDHEQATINRLISSCLRHGMDIKHLCSQLGKVRGNLYDLAIVLARVLKKFNVEGTHTGEKCPQCQANIIFAEGCTKCSLCEWSKC